MKSLNRFFTTDEGVEINWEYVESIPNFAKLKECPQNPKWHSEGNAWIHTQRCVEAMIKRTADWVSVSERRDMVLAALFHDIGKSETTIFSKGNWHSYGHEIVGEKLTRYILWDLPFATRENICALVRCHMDILKIADSKHPIETMLHLKHCVNVRYLVLLKQCDLDASIQEDKEGKERDYKALDVALECYQHLILIPTGYKSAFNKAVKAYLYRFKHKGLTENLPTVYVLIGLPGAGKNYYLSNNLPTVFNVSRDDVRAELGYCNEGDKVVLSEEQEKEVTKVCQERIVKAISEGHDVVVNDTNLKRKYRDALKTLLRDFNVRYKYIYIESPSLQTNIERRPTIPPSVFENMIKNTLDMPSQEEYDELIYHVL